MRSSTSIPKINFSHLNPSAPGNDATWCNIRGQVMAAMSTIGCFEAEYPALNPQLRDAFFNGAVKELFALPTETKKKNYYGPQKPFHGYLGGLPGLDRYESVAIIDGPKQENVKEFEQLFWPHGKPGFCETVHTAAKLIADLDEMVRRMVFEGLEVSEYLEAQNGSTWHLFRMSEYTAPDSEDKEMGYVSHQDTNTLSIVCQHEIDGLEVQTRDGHWILVEPSQTTLTVMAGNALRAWTNDRVYAPFHRVMMGGETTRYSAILFSVPSNVIQAPEELVNEDHPSHFKPYEHDEFVRFCVSKEGAQFDDKLEVYCGVSAAAVVEG